MKLPLAFIPRAAAALSAGFALLAGCATAPGPAPSGVATGPAGGAPVAAADEAGLPAPVRPAQPVIPGGTFSLADFGGVPDGTTPNTEAFHRAVAAVGKAGGGTLVVPAGRWYTLPFDLCSGMNLHLDAGATIQFSPHPEDYQSPGGGKFRPLLQTRNAHDVMISGSGTIDGSGQAWWTEAFRFKQEANARHARNNTSPRPRMVVFDHCQRVRVEGVTLTNSPVFNLVPSNCSDVTIEGITIYNPHLQAPNTDGIDPSVCQRVLISHCRIDTDDDNIAVKAGGAGGAVTQDLLITGCTFLHGHGCSIGSETYSGLRNMTVRDCTFEGTDTGVRLKSDRTRGGVVENVIYTDLTMKNVGVAISITSFYQGTTNDSAAQMEAQPVTSKTPHWKNIVVRNVTAVGGTKAAGLIMGLPEMPAEDITLQNISIEAPTGLRIGNFKDVTLRKVHIVVAEGEPVIADHTGADLTQTD